MRKPKDRMTQWHNVVRKITRQRATFEESKRSTPESRLHHYTVDGLYILANVLFVIGSYDFFDDIGDSLDGAWLFIIGSTIVASLSSMSLIETYLHHSHAASQNEVQEEEQSASVVVCSPVSQVVSMCGGPQLDTDAKREVEEESLYLVSSFVFMAGCWMGYVQKRQSEGAREHAEAASIWLFIAGSFGFLLGSFYNALGLNAGTSNGVPGAKLGVYALLCGLVGSLFFFTGSYLYRPGLADGCTVFEAKEQAAEGEVPCVTASQTGTWLYVIGSLIFLLQSLLNLCSAITKHREEARILSNPLFLYTGGKAANYGAVPSTARQVHV